jgi:hypothetical protein
MTIDEDADEERSSGPGMNGESEVVDSEPDVSDDRRYAICPTYYVYRYHYY